VILDNGEIIGKGFEDIDSKEYNKIKHFKNPYLAMLFVADPYSIILEPIRRKKIALLTGDSDDLYILEVASETTKPIVKAILKDDPYKNIFLDYMKKNKKIHPNFLQYLN